MKIIAAVSLLLAASMSSFAVSASPLSREVEARQVVEFAPTVPACAAGPDCVSAAAWWSDCQDAHAVGIPLEPSSNVRSCLCSPARAIPSRLDWFSNLKNCIFCIEMVVGNQGPGAPLHAQIDAIAGSSSSFVGYCKSTLTTSGFVEEIQEVVKAKSFPLCLPEAILPVGARDVGSTGASLTLAGRDKASATSTTSSCSASESSGFTFNPPTGTFAPISLPPCLPHEPGNTMSPLGCKPSEVSTGLTNTLVSPRALHHGCGQDNCLRQAIRSAPAAASLCDLYTQATDTFSAGLQKYLSHCEGSSSRVSSACSCLGRHISSVSKAISTADESANHLPTVVPSYAPTLSLTSRPPNHAMAFSAPEASSAFSLSPGLSTTPASSAALTFSTFPFSPGPSIAPSSVSPSAQATHTPSNGTHWTTIPANAKILNCARREYAPDCTYAGSIFHRCLKSSNPHHCLCSINKSNQQWKVSVTGCADCIAKAYPGEIESQPSWTMSMLTRNVGLAQDVYCASEKNDEDGIKHLKSAGLLLTKNHQSPIKFWDMTVLTEPLDVDG
ncbi:hypothetical protein JHW43_000739 [Diplocarpon mali]|nr:hypothetical protein JHW43_000739 [Diplocarpon mali]